jgi:4-diphosphocytidyl-2-C-methyl-D-erythritol kinase
VLLVLPPFRVNTAEAYGWLAAARDAGYAAAPDATGVLDASALVDWSTIARVATNEFESIVATRHPMIESLLARLRELGCAPAMMSGSGSTLFGVLPRATAVDLPRFDCTLGGPAPRVLFTRTSVAVAPVVPVA